jgi:hypothetical protein
LSSIICMPWTYYGQLTSETNHKPIYRFLLKALFGNLPHRRPSQTDMWMKLRDIREI